MPSERASDASSAGEGKPLDMNTQEMKAKGFYMVKALLRTTYRHRSRFLVKWEAYSMGEAIWEPYTAFILDQGNVSSLPRLLRGTRSPKTTQSGRGT